MGIEILSEVFEVIKDRRDLPREGSYVSGLLAGGEGKVSDKLREEIAELIEASKLGDKREIVREAADALFHLMVLLAAKGVELEEVAAELEGRRRR